MSDPKNAKKRFLKAKPRTRRNATGGTAEAAAKAITPHAPTIRERVLNYVRRTPATGEEVFAALTDEGVKTTLYSVKPRLSEAAKEGLVCDSGERGISNGGKCRSIVWRAMSPEETAAFHAAKEAEDANG